jgi:hypothetical protein
MTGVDWNEVLAITSIVTVPLIVVGGAIALNQLRESRRAAQFDGTQRMVDRMLDLDFNAAVRFVIDELPSRLGDDRYRTELATTRGWNLDPKGHPELVVLTRLEELGIYLRHRLLLGDAVLDFTAELIMLSWEHLTDVVTLMRTSHRNPNVWSNAEFLYERAQHHRSKKPARN